MRLSEYCNIIKNIIKDEGDLDVERLIIAENEALMLIKDKMYTVDDFEEKYINTGEVKL